MSIWTHRFLGEPDDDGNDPLGVPAEDSINYGTHTLPKKFWTSGKAPLLHDSAFLARRAAKHARHLKNQAAKAEANQSASSPRSKKS